MAAAQILTLTSLTCVPHPHSSPILPYSVILQLVLPAYLYLRPSDKMSLIHSIHYLTQAFEPLNVW